MLGSGFQCPCGLSGSCHSFLQHQVELDYYRRMHVLLGVKTTVFVALCLGLVAGVMFLLGSTFWAAPYGSGIIVGQENWSSLFTMAGLAFSGASGLFLVRGQNQKTLVGAFRLIIPLVPVGILLALGTGWVMTDQGVNPGGISATNYGFPFIWRVQQSSCPPPCPSKWYHLQSTILRTRFAILHSCRLHPSRISAKRKSGSRNP